MAGTRLGPYQIAAQIGKGGMGEVYRATDTNLGRQVAIKILPEAFAHDPGRVARFQREAKTLAALNHPNIGGIYGLEEARVGPADAGFRVQALVLELVEGPTLADRVARGPIPVAEALSIARQIADALDAAHEHGIIHRDLKPANIKAREDGTVKVLDFGLAKTAIAPGEQSQAPTATIDGTRQGTIVGTAAYMSPEQTRGLAVDRRTDVWAFGCVLYEMLAGQAVFAGDTVSDTIAAILERKPDWRAIPPRTPAGIRTLLQRCLEKDPRRRLRDIADARLDLDDALAGADVDAAASGTKAPGHRGLWAAGLLGALAIAGVVVWSLASAARSSTDAPPGVARFLVVPPEPLPIVTDGAVTVSPDGRQIVYVAERENSRRLYARGIDQFESRAIPGTEGADSPRFSPDGAWIAFVADRKLKKVALVGGEVIVVTDFTEGRGLTWESNDAILFNLGRGSGIWRVPASGGKPAMVTALQQGDIEHDFPEVVAGGSGLLFSVRGGAATVFYEIYAQPGPGGERHRIASGVGATYLPSRHLVYVQANTLYALPFDPVRLEPVGMPVAVVRGVAQTGTGAPLFSVSPSGVLAYVATRETGRRDALVWVDEKGMEQPTGAAGGEYAQPHLAPDGRRVAVTLGPGEVQGGNQGDLWLYDFARETWSRFTFDGRSHFPLWVPDGRSLAFSSARNGPFDIYRRPIDGASAEERLVSGGDGTNYPLSWSPDGDTLAYVSVSPTTANDIWVLPRGGQARPFLQTQFREGGPAFSPDGRWMAYASDRSGRIEVYMRPYPGPGEEWTISNGGGNEPVWAARAGRLFYRQGRTMMAVDVTPGPPAAVSKPRRLFEGPYRPTLGFYPNYDVAADGTRLLMVKTVEEGRAPTEINVVVNWSEELKRLVPVN